MAETHNDSEPQVSWRKALEAKKDAVRSYMKSLTDDTLFKICFLYMQGFDDKAVMKELDISEFALAQCKGRIAEGLQLAGITLRK